MNPMIEGHPWLQLDTCLRPLAYLLRGLLNHQVLLPALSKRWRVEYDLHLAETRRMAVPYRAIDVASRMTEFDPYSLRQIEANSFEKFPSICPQVTLDLSSIFPREPSEAGQVAKKLSFLGLAFPCLALHFLLVMPCLVVP